MTAKTETLEKKTQTDPVVSITEINTDADKPPPIQSPPIKDLTDITSRHWPGNPSVRIGSFYINLNRLELDQGQSGMIGALAQNFVYERAYIQGIEAPDKTADIELLMEDDRPLGRYTLKEGCTTAIRINSDDGNAVPEGSFQGGQNVYIRLLGEPPGRGRIVINFVGYLIEPWR